MFWFVFASVMPACLLLAGGLLGGILPVFAVFSITVVTFFADRVSRAPGYIERGEKAAAVLPLCLAGLHFTLWGFGIWALGTGGALTAIEKATIFVGLSLYFGQISNSNAHELIHNPNRMLQRVGMVLYGSLLFAHHTSAHLKIHHRFAATPHDPNTAPRGQGFWVYFPRAWWGGFRAGLHAENAMRRRALHPSRLHPYAIYCALHFAAIFAAFSLGGTSGALWLIAIALYAQVQLYLSDYVQHYGLTRSKLVSGKFEPIGPAHSWNAPNWYSSAMMLNAPKHSDHHVHPSRRFQDLIHDAETMPTLPQSLPVMAVIALVPPLWRRVMHPLLERQTSRRMDIAAE